MRKVIRIISIICFIISGFLFLLGLLTLDPGGLMFALPYFFLIPAVIFALVGGMFFLFTRESKESEKMIKDNSADERH